MSETPDVQVVQQPEQQRYEATSDGEVVGVLAYEMLGSSVVMTHTEVEESAEGHGVGSALARAALDDVRRGGGSVVPQCPFVASWIEKHPDYADLVAQDA